MLIKHLAQYLAHSSCLLTPSGHCHILERPHEKQKGNWRCLLHTEAPYKGQLWVGLTW